jgi:hypothetical protein
VKRREFITIAVSAAAMRWPVIARAQPFAHVPRIGYLGLGPASAWASRVEALREGLRDFGYAEGKNRPARSDQTLGAVPGVLEFQPDAQRPDMPLQVPIGHLIVAAVAAVVREAATRHSQAG